MTSKDKDHRRQDRQPSRPAVTIPEIVITDYDLEMGNPTLPPDYSLYDQEGEFEWDGHLTAYFATLSLEERSGKRFFTPTPSPASSVCGLDLDDSDSASSADRAFTTATVNSSSSSSRQEEEGFVPSTGCGLGDWKPDPSKIPEPLFVNRHGRQVPGRQHRFSVLRWDW